MSLTAMMDALGHVLGEAAYAAKGEYPRLAQAAELARRIDASRRRRPK